MNPIVYCDKTIYETSAKSRILYIKFIFFIDKSGDICYTIDVR